MAALSDMSQDAPNPFRMLWDGGYRRLVPIVPPDAELSPHSSLARRPGCRGKAVGVKGSGGWHGFNWHVNETTEEDLDRWHAMGAGVGLRMGQGLVAIDIDALDPELAAAAAQAAFEILCVAPRRFGRAPKLLLLYRTATDLPYERIEFDGLDGKTERVEALGPGQQAVMLAVHPGTGRSYLWPDGIPVFDDLPEITAEQKEAYFDRLVEIMPNGRRPSAPNSVDRAQVDQQSLAAPAPAVRKAVDAIPNDRSDRAWNIRMAAAIKAAVPDDPDEAFDIYWSWCQRWTVRDKEHDHAWSDFQSIGERRGIGAPYLFALASSETNEVMTPPELFFAPIADGEEPDTSAFGDDGGPGGGSGAAAASTMFEWIDPASWVGVERPEQRWFVKGLVPHGEVTLLTGKGGIGKSLVTLQMLTAIALGVPFLGRETMQAKVMGMFCEDGEDVLHARQKDICLAVMHELSDLSSNMRLASRKYEDNLLSIWDRSSSSMRLSKVYAALERDVLAFGAKVVVLDTIADTFGGDEINRAQVRQFIQACAGRLAKAIDGAVILLGHPSRSGEQSGEGTSGSTAWHATVRSRLYLEETGKPGSGYRRLTSMKANYGPAGDSWVLKWQRGVLEPVSSSQTVAGAVSEAGMPETASVLERAVLKAVAEANADGVRMAVGKTSKFRVEPILRRRSTDSLMAFTPAEVDEAVLDLIAKGQIVEAPLGRDGARHPVMTLTVCPPKTPGNVFD